MATTTLTRVAHASVLLDFDGHTILTDPWLSEKPGYYQGERRAFASAADLPELAGVVVSHGHYDHFDMDAFAAYPDKSVPMVLKRGLAAEARAHGFTNITELDAWESTTVGPVHITGRPNTRSPKSPTSWKAQVAGSSSVGTPCASPNSTKSPTDSAISTWRCCRSTA
jgi:L-ascorbate metabolism protein UlaG (beta-lactamase superfamily)